MSNFLSLIKSRLENGNQLQPLGESGWVRAALVQSCQVWLPFTLARLFHSRVARLCISSSSISSLWQIDVAIFPSF